MNITRTPPPPLLFHLLTVLNHPAVVAPSHTLTALSSQSVSLA